VKNFFIFSICFFILVFSFSSSSAENLSLRNETIDTTLRDCVIDTALAKAEVAAYPGNQYAALQPGDTQTSQATTPSRDNSSWPSKIRLFVGGATHGRGIYYIDYLLPLYYSADQDNLVFFNPKEHLESPFQEETNLGLGLRRIFFDQFILGINYFYDKSYSLNRKLYSQNGGGLELLSEPLDLRFNYYKPVTKAKIVDTTYKFAARGLMQIDSMEEPLEGFDFEVGGPVFDKYTKTRAYAGGFFYNSRLSKDIRGVRFRTETSLSNWLAIDNILDSSENGRIDITSGIRVNLPFEWGRLRNAENPFDAAAVISDIKDRIFERVVRDLNVRSSSSPQTSVEHSLTYVDNSNTNPAPDGTLDNPYTTITDAVNHVTDDKWTYVKEGLSQDPIPTYYSGDITLPSDVVLWGSGYGGGYRGLSVSGIYPVINGGADAITINNNNTVMGLQIQNATNDGIKFTNGTTLTGVIAHNQLLANAQDGIDLSHNTGTMSGFAMLGNTADGNGENGIDMSYNSGTMSNFIISNNTVNGNSNIGINLSPNGYADNGGTATGTMSNFIISGNTANGNGYTGIDLAGNGLVAGGGGTAIGTMSNFSILGNTVNDNAFEGIQLSGNQAGGSLSNFIISGNTVNDNISAGIDLGRSAATMSNFSIFGNMINGNTGDGIDLDSNAGTLSDFVISGNTVNGNGFDGIDLQGNQAGASISNFTISGNTADGNEWDGIDLSGNGGEMSNFTISGNMANNNEWDGIDLSLNAGTMSNFTISGNVAHDTVFISGLDLSENAGTMSGFTISHNTLNNNDSGIYMGSNYGSMSDFTILGNTANNNIYMGMDISNSAVGAQYGTLSDFTISDNTTDNNGNNGLSLYAYLSSISNVTISGNSVNNNGNHGIYLGAWFWMGHIGSLSNITFSGNTVTGNAKNGINLIAADGGTMSGIILGNGTTGGNNSIYGNNTSHGSYYDIRNDSGINILPAEYNWWGTANPQASQFGGSNTVDYTHPLLSNPN
jgi:hypothetical protein